MLCCVLRSERHGHKITQIERMIIAAGRNWEHEEGGILKHELQSLFTAIAIIENSTNEYESQKKVHFCRISPLFNANNEMLLF